MQMAFQLTMTFSESVAKDDDLLFSCQVVVCITGAVVVGPKYCLDEGFLLLQSGTSYLLLFYCNPFSKFVSSFISKNSTVRWDPL